MVTEPAPKASRCSEGSAWKPSLSPVARGKGIVLRCVCMGYRFGHTAQGSYSVTGLRHVPKQSLLCAAFKNYVCCVYGVNVPHQTYWRTFFFFKEHTGLLILILLLKQMSLSHPEEKLSSPHPTPCSLSLSNIHIGRNEVLTYCNSIIFNESPGSPFPALCQTTVQTSGLLQF